MIGKLVRINRASIGVPKGTLGLVVDKRMTEVSNDHTSWMVYYVQLCQPNHRERQYLERDLEGVEVCSE